MIFPYDLHSGKHSWLGNPHQHFRFFAGKTIELNEGYGASMVECPLITGTTSPSRPDQLGGMVLNRFIEVEDDAPYSYCKWRFLHWVTGRKPSVMNFCKYVVPVGREINHRTAESWMTNFKLG